MPDQVRLLGDCFVWKIHVQKPHVHTHAPLTPGFWKGIVFLPFPYAYPYTHRVKLPLLTTLHCGLCTLQGPSPLAGKEQDSGPLAEHR